MSRLSDHLVAIETWMKTLQHAGGPLVADCRQQLDLLDGEDIDTQCFQDHGGFLVLPRWRFVHRADGGRDCELHLVLGIATRGTASVQPDADALERAVTLLSALDGATFGQSACSEPADLEARPLVQVGLERKGISIVGVSFKQVLYRVIEPPAQVTGLIGAYGTGTRPGDPQTFTDPGLTPEEQAAIGAWGAP